LRKTEILAVDPRELAGPVLGDAPGQPGF